MKENNVQDKILKIKISWQILHFETSWYIFIIILWGMVLVFNQNLGLLCTDKKYDSLPHFREHSYSSSGLLFGFFPSILSVIIKNK